MEAIDSAWRPLHLRAAKGEVLNPSESALLQEAYRTQDALEQTELSAGRIQQLQHLRGLRDEKIALLQKTKEAGKQRRQISVRINRLAAALDLETREALGLLTSP